MAGYGDDSWNRAVYNRARSRLNVREPARFRGKRESLMAVKNIGDHFEKRLQWLDGVEIARGDGLVELLTNTFSHCFCIRTWLETEMETVHDS